MPSCECYMLCHIAHSTVCFCIVSLILPVRLSIRPCIHRSALFRVLHFLLVFTNKLIVIDNMHIVFDVTATLTVVASNIRKSNLWIYVFILPALLVICKPLHNEPLLLMLTDSIYASQFFFFSLCWWLWLYELKSYWIISFKHFPSFGLTRWWCMYKKQFSVLKYLKNFSRSSIC